MNVPSIALAASIFTIALSTNVEAAMQASDADADAEVADEEDPDQRIRCRSRRVTGSNARRIRTCMTIAEWEQLSSEGNRDSRLVMDETTVFSCRDFSDGTCADSNGTPINTGSPF